MEKFNPPSQLLISAMFLVPLCVVCFVCFSDTHDVVLVFSKQRSLEWFCEVVCDQFLGRFVCDCCNHLVFQKFSAVKIFDVDMSRSLGTRFLSTSLQLYCACIILLHNVGSPYELCFYAIIGIILKLMFKESFCPYYEA